MSGGENWQVGDLALCIKKPRHSPGIKQGGVYAVSAVWPFRDWTGEIGLEFAGVGGGPEVPGFHNAFAASRFRKVTPPKADEFDLEVIEAMKSGRVSA